MFLTLYLDVNERPFQPLKCGQPPKDPIDSGGGAVGVCNAVASGWGPPTVWLICKVARVPRKTGSHSSVLP